jgi:hypothetical protein
VVKLEITPQGQETFSIGSYRHKAMHYVVKVKIGGVTGWDSVPGWKATS